MVDGFGTVCISIDLLGRAVRRVAGRGGGGQSWHLAMVWRAAVGWLAWGWGVVRGLGWHIEMVLACRGGRVGWTTGYQHVLQVPKSLLWETK